MYFGSHLSHLLTRDSQFLIVVAPPDVGVKVSPKPPRAWSPSILQPRTTSGPSTRPAYSPPILNLTGLPLPASEEPEGSPYKKRKRKRKKKKSTGEQGVEKGPL